MFAVFVVKALAHITYFFLLLTLLVRSLVLLKFHQQKTISFANIPFFRKPRNYYCDCTVDTNGRYLIFTSAPHIRELHDIALPKPEKKTFFLKLYKVFNFLVVLKPEPITFFPGARAHTNLLRC